MVCFMWQHFDYYLMFLRECFILYFVDRTTLHYTTKELNKLLISCDSLIGIHPLVSSSNPVLFWGPSPLFHGPSSRIELQQHYGSCKPRRHRGNNSSPQRASPSSAPEWLRSGLPTSDPRSTSKGSIPRIRTSGWRDEVPISHEWALTSVTHFRETGQWVKAYICEEYTHSE